MFVFASSYSPAFFSVDFFQCEENMSFGKPLFPSKTMDGHVSPWNYKTATNPVLGFRNIHLGFLFASKRTRIPTLGNVPTGFPMEARNLSNSKLVIRSLSQPCSLSPFSNVHNMLLEMSLINEGANVGIQTGINALLLRQRSMTPLGTLLGLVQTFSQVLLTGA
jgi:hypothetical protein